MSRLQGESFLEDGGVSVCVLERGSPSQTLLSFVTEFLYSTNYAPPMSVSRIFSSVRAVLQGACHMVAMQISAEPLVRQALRQVFQSRAVLNVKPTKKGKKV